MPHLRATINSRTAGSMMDRLAPEAQGLGLFAEIRNVDRSRRTWGRRYGWAKRNTAQMPFERCVGQHAFLDSDGVRHHVVLGGDGKPYRVWDDGTYSEITMHCTVLWDAEDDACFARWRDHLFIAIGSTQGESPARNMRYDAAKGAIYGVGLPTPASAPTAAAQGAGTGTLQAATYTFLYTWVDDDLGWPSPVSDTVAVTVAEAAGQNEIQEIAAVAAPTGGTYRLGYNQEWTVELAYDAAPADVEDALEALSSFEAGDVAVSGSALSAGTLTVEFGSAAAPVGTDLGAVGLLWVNGDNLTPSGTVVNVTRTQQGALYGDANESIEVTVPAYSGTGRTVSRLVYCDIDGAGFGYIGQVAAGDATLTYDAATAGAALTSYQNIPACRYVAVQVNGLVLWANDAANEEPATIYVAYDGSHPENIGVVVHAGSDDDPITALKPYADGVVVFKRRQIRWYPRQCEEVCQSIVDSVGCISHWSVQEVGGRLGFLSAEGPRVYTPGEVNKVPFAGPDAHQFALGVLWDTVYTPWLKHASSVLDTRRGVLAWFVRLCEQPNAGAADDHNDIAILWEYANRSELAPDGTLGVHDLLVDHCCLLPSEGDDEDVPLGSYPCGWTGPLWAGNHGDGTTELVLATVTAVDGADVWVDGDDLPSDLAGSLLHIYEGAGTRVCQDVDVCLRHRSVVLSDTVESAGRRLTLGGDVGAAEGSLVFFGGFNYAMHGYTDLGDPHPYKHWKLMDVHLRRL